MSQNNESIIIKKGRPLGSPNKTLKYNLLIKNVMLNCFDNAGSFDSIKSIHTFLLSRDIDITHLTLQRIFYQDNNNFIKIIHI